MKTSEMSNLECTLLFAAQYACIHLIWFLKALVSDLFSVLADSQSPAGGIRTGNEKWYQNISSYNGSPLVLHIVI